MKARAPHVRVIAVEPETAAPFALSRQQGRPCEFPNWSASFVDGAGGKTFLFGAGGAEKAARDLGVPFLGALPIFPDLRIASDEGEPIAARAPQSAAALAFDALAARIAETFSEEA